MSQQDEVVHFILSNPFTMLIAGPTKSGKTTFVDNLIKNSLNEECSLFTLKPTFFFYFYNQERPKQEGLHKNIHEFIEGLPTMEWLAETKKEYGDNITVIIDDQALNINKDTAELFSVGSSRQECNVILLTQNLFGKKKENRDISLNSTYIILFKNPRDKLSVQSFFRQIDPQNQKKLIDIYLDATKKAYSYVFVDLFAETDEDNRLLSNIYCENGDDPILYRYN